MRNSVFILLCLILSGCSGSLQSSWNNFRGYYNTYYNAKKSFNAGLAKIHEQPVEIDPSGVVRVHPAPVPAGAADFNKAIEKGADLLRNFPESKWTDDALLLIGKSYYYQENFYPALQKFEELYALAGEENGKMKEYAALWKGRTLLDLEQYDQGIDFLSGSLAELSFNGRPAVMGEMMVMLAEHHAFAGNWERCSELLSEALTALNAGSLKGKSYFLFGQSLERQERYGEAYFAYSNVGPNHPDYEFVYWAQVKLADVARQEGNLDKALAIYQSMKNDDKNYERRNELDYQIGRTYEMKGEFRLAVSTYKRLLRNSQPPAGTGVRGDTYYRLGELYSNELNDFGLAAAYYDSSSTDQLAEAYGRYTQLRNRSEMIDSLLWLGSLPAASLDSVLQVAKRRQQDALMRQEAEQKRRTILNTGNGGALNPAEYSAGGFLNYRNPERVEESRNAFRAVWGDRPLADHWRRMEMVAGITVQGDGRPDDKTPDGNRGSAAPEAAEEIDVSRIPGTEEERKRLENEKADIHHRIGNLFFLTLNQPDSAAARYRRVIRSYPDHPAAPQSMYSLVEIFSSTGQPDSASYWAGRLLGRYPETVYAQTISEQYRRGPDSVSRRDTREEVKQWMQAIDSDTALPAVEKAGILQHLALENRALDIAPGIYIRSIEEYIRVARQYTDSASYSDWIREDSLRPVEQYPFLNEYWDSVRVALARFDTTFQQGPHHARLEQLNRILITEYNRQPRCELMGIALQPADSTMVQPYPGGVPVTWSLVVSREGEVQSFAPVTVSAPPPALQASRELLEKMKFRPLDEQGEGRILPEVVRCRFTFGGSNPTPAL